MKNYKSFIILSIFSLFVLLSCEEENEWKGSQYPNIAHNIKIIPTVSNISDFSAKLSMEASEAGIVYVLVQEQGLTAPTDSFNFPEEDNVMSVEFTATGTKSIDITQLTDGTSYDVYTVFTNSEGAPGPFGTMSFNTSDDTYPTLVSMIPEANSKSVSKSISTIQLTFSEPVVIADVSKIKVVDVFDESALSNIGNITVNGKVASIEVTDVFDFSLDVAVIIDSAAFKDVSGNNCPEYYTDSVDGEEVYELMFTIEPIIDLSVFNGAYHCVANEIGFGNGKSEYDVLISGGKDTEGYYFEIQNIRNWTASVVYLTVDPTVDTCFFDEQPTGNTYDSEDILIRSNDIYNIASASFKPGTFIRDGSEIKVFGQIFISAGSFGFYEFTFTKFKDNAVISNSGREDIISSSDIKKYNN
jgi:hypothetical protein